MILGNNSLAFMSYSNIKKVSMIVIIVVWI